MTPDGPLDDTSFHTTSIAAVLVGNGKGTGPGGAGILGVAPGSTLRTYAIFNTTDPSKHQNLMCNLLAMPQLIDRIVADGADVVEIPVTVDGAGGEFTAALNRAMNKGVMFVAGAGNGGPNTIPMRPADEQGVLVVGGITRDAQYSPLSPTSSSPDWEAAQLGTKSTFDIHVVAPANDILGGSAVGGKWESNYLQNGTSGASAIVTGLLALMKQKWPKATGNQLLYSLLRNASKPPGGPVWTPRGGFGTVSFANSLSVDPTQYPDVHPFYGHLGNVVSDHPQKPFIPEAVGPDGLIPQAPPTTSDPPSTKPSASPTSTAGAPATSAPPLASGDRPDGRGGVGGLLAGGVAGLIVVVGALAFLLRNRRGTPRVNVSDTAAEGKDSR